MESNQDHNARESGEKVWESFQNQLGEAKGFFGAMYTSFKGFVKRQLLFILVFGVLFAALSTAWFYMQPKVFEAEMTLSYVHLEKKIYADMLAKLDQLAANEMHEVLSELLALDLNEASDLVGIKSFNIKDEVLTEDISTEKIPFYIRVQVKDLDMLDELEEGLVHYLNNGRFVKERLNYMKEKSVKELAFLNQRLDIADSLSRMIILKSSANDEKTITRVELLEETMLIYKRIQDVEGGLRFNVNIEVMDGFIANNKPMGKGLYYYLLYGFLLGMAIRLVLLVFI